MSRSLFKYVFNLFFGFKATLPLTAVSNFTPILPILDLIYSVYANKDMSSFRWIMSFLAQPIRYKRKTQAVLVLVGPPECDLNILFQWEHKYIYGELNYHFEQHAFDQYNEFITEHEEELKRKTVTSAFLDWYGRKAVNQYELFRSIRNDELIHRNRSIREIGMHTR